MTAKEKIDKYISKTDDWRGDLIQQIRDLIHETEPGIVEEWKWNSPVFSFNGKMICSPGAFKNHVGLNFFNGAMIEDSNSLFNSGLESKRSRSINFKQENELNTEALKELLENALNLYRN